MLMEVSTAYLMEVAREAKLSSYAISGTTQAVAVFDRCKLAFYVAELAGHILSPRKKNVALKVHRITDSRSLYETLGSTKLVSDIRLRVEISALQQMDE